MNTKKSILGYSLLAAMMTSMEEYDYMERKISTPKSKPKKRPKKVTEFHKDEGVAKTIQDYKLIQKGLSKKGQLKQTRIVNKIESWLSSGQLTEKHLKD